MPRPKQRTPELRETVLTTAADLLGREGAGGFTTRRVAREAGTSPPAVYELFGDKAGLVREIFFEGFRRLRAALGETEDSADPLADLEGLVDDYRGFIRANPEIAAVMFSRPFSDFDPRPAELEASGSVRAFIVERVRRCVDAGLLQGDVTDIAHALVALVQGLAAAENARRLGTSQKSIDRRWRLATGALLRGLSPSA